MERTNLTTDDFDAVATAVYRAIDDSPSQRMDFSNEVQKNAPLHGDDEDLNEDDDDADADADDDEEEVEEGDDEYDDDEDDAEADALNDIDEDLGQEMDNNTKSPFNKDINEEDDGDENENRNAIIHDDEEEEAEEAEDDEEDEGNRSLRENDQMDKTIKGNENCEIYHYDNNADVALQNEDDEYIESPEEDQEKEDPSDSKLPDEPIIYQDESGRIKKLTISHTKNTSTSNEDSHNFNIIKESRIVKDSTLSLDTDEKAVKPRSSTPYSREYKALQKSVNESKILTEFVTDASVVKNRKLRRKKIIPRNILTATPPTSDHSYSSKRWRSAPKHQQADVDTNDVQAMGKKRQHSKRFIPLKDEGADSVMARSSRSRSLYNNYSDNSNSNSEQGKKRSKSVQKYDSDSSAHSPLYNKWPSEENVNNAAVNLDSISGAGKRTNMRSENSEFVQKQKEFLHQIKISTQDTPQRRSRSHSIALDSSVDGVGGGGGVSITANDEKISSSSKSRDRSSKRLKMDIDGPEENDQPMLRSSTNEPLNDDASVNTSTNSVGAANTSGEFDSNVDNLEAFVKNVWQAPPKPGSDSFCWKCHESNVDLSCSKCTRSYHAACAKVKVGDNMCVCPECLALDNILNNTKRSRRNELPLDLLSQLLSFALKRMRYAKGHYSFHMPYEEDNVYKKIIINPVTFDSIQAKVEAKEYRCVDEFVNDTKWMLHNAHILAFGNSTKTISSTKAILKICRQEANEIETCAECYLNANTRTDWFVDVCCQPHLLLWAKLKGFPYWPAKAMGLGPHSLVNVKFFGEHDRAFVPLKDCFLYSVQDPNTQTGKRAAKELADCIKEVGEHIERIIAKVGGFCYAPFKTPYDPNDEMRQLENMMPGVQEFIKRQQIVQNSKPSLQFKIYKTADNNMSIVQKDLSHTQSNGGNLENASPLPSTPMESEDNNGVILVIQPSKKKKGFTTPPLPSPSTTAMAVGGGGGDEKSSDSKNITAAKYEVILKLSNDDSNSSKLSPVILKRKSANGVDSNNKKPPEEENTTDSGGGGGGGVVLPKLAKIDEKLSNTEVGIVNTQSMKRKADPMAGEKPKLKHSRSGEMKFPIVSIKNLNVQKEVEHLNEETNESPIVSNERQSLPQGLEEQKQKQQHAEQEQHPQQQQQYPQQQQQSPQQLQQNPQQLQQNPQQIQQNAQHHPQQEQQLQQKDSEQQKETNYSQKLVESLVKNKQGVTIKKIVKNNSNPIAPITSIPITSNVNDPINSTPVNPSPMNLNTSSSSSVSNSETNKTSSSTVNSKEKPPNDNNSLTSSAKDKADQQQKQRDVVNNILKGLKPFVEIKQEVLSDKEEESEQRPEPEKSLTNNELNKAIEKNSTTLPQNNIPPCNKSTEQLNVNTNSTNALENIPLLNVKEEIFSDEEEQAIDDNAPLLPELAALNLPGTNKSHCEGSSHDAQMMGETAIQKETNKNSSAVPGNPNNNILQKRNSIKGIPYGPLPKTCIPPSNLNDMGNINSRAKKSLIQNSPPIAMSTSTFSSSSTTASYINSSNLINAHSNVSHQNSELNKPTMSRTTMVTIPVDYNNAATPNSSSISLGIGMSSIPVPPLTAVSKVQSYPGHVHNSLAPFNTNNNNINNSAPAASTVQIGQSISSNTPASLITPTIQNQLINLNSTSASMPLATAAAARTSLLSSTSLTSLTTSVAARKSPITAAAVNNNNKVPQAPLIPPQTKNVLTMSTPPPLAGLSGTSLINPTAITSVELALNKASLVTTNATGSQTDCSSDTQLLSGLVVPTLATAMTDIISRGPPKLASRPRGPLQSEGYPIHNSQAGPVSKIFMENAHKITDYFISVMEDTMSEIAQGSEASLQARIVLLEKELERTKQSYEQQMSELKRTTELMRIGMENEKTRLINDIRKQCEAERLRSIEETKRKQWCAQCRREANFYCCWNTSYCGYPCQQLHWGKHALNCAQTRTPAVEASSTSNNTTTQDHRPQNKSNNNNNNSNSNSSATHNSPANYQCKSSSANHSKKDKSFNKNSSSNNMMISHSPASASSLSTSTRSNNSQSSEVLKLPSNTYLRPVNNTPVNAQTLRCNTTYSIPVQRFNVPLPMTTHANTSSPHTFTIVRQNNGWAGPLHMANNANNSTVAAPIVSVPPQGQSHRNAGGSGSGGSGPMIAANKNTKTQIRYH